MNLLFLICLLSSNLLPEARIAPTHEFHMSKCQIEYNVQEKALQMTMHLFIDDLEEALRLDGIDKLYLCTDKETTDADSLLYGYLQKNFLLQVNQQEAPYDFIGKEQSEDLIGLWVYLEITEVEQLEAIDITNRVLIKAFNDQKNITSVSVPPGKQNYFILQKGKEQESIVY